MHVSLTPQLEEHVKNKVATGLYNNAQRSCARVASSYAGKG